MTTTTTFRKFNIIFVFLFRFHYFGNLNNDDEVDRGYINKVTKRMCLDGRSYRL